VVLILLVIALLSVYSSTGSLAYQHREGNTFFYVSAKLQCILSTLDFRLFSASPHVLAS
jgi:hypothetical protein